MFENDRRLPMPSARYKYFGGSGSDGSRSIKPVKEIEFRIDRLNGLHRRIQIAFESLPFGRASFPAGH